MQNSKKIGVFAVLAAPVAAFAQTAPTVNIGSITGTLVSSMTTAVGDIITQVSPLLALGFGLAAAVRWVKKGVKG